MDLTKWGLHPLLAENLVALDLEYPGLVEIVGGHRDLEGQASAMAANVARDRQWIAATYTREDRPSFGIAQRLQAAVNGRPDVTAQDALFALLHAELAAIPNGSLISFHTFMLLGKPASLAVDLKPIVERGTMDPTRLGRLVIERIRTLPHFDSFMQKEGNLLRWHWQILPPLARPTVEV